MKTKLTLVLCAAVIAVAGGETPADAKGTGGAAATKANQPDVIRLEITDRLAVRAVVDSKYKTCQLTSSGWIQDVSNGVIADSSSGDFMQRRFLQRLLSEEIRCTTKVRPRTGGTTQDAPGWGDPLQVTRASSLADLKAKSVANIQMFGPTYLFPSEDPLAALVANILVKEDASCKMVNPSADAPKEDNCKLILSGGSFKIVPNGDVPAGATRVELKYPAKGATKQEVHLPIGSCNYTLNGSLSVLVQGARKQRISLAYQTGWDAKCSAFLYEARTLAEGNHTIHLKRAASTVPTQGEVFDAEPIPVGLAPGVHNFQVKSASGVVGTLTANVIAPPAMKENSKIQVKYNVQGSDPSRIPTFDAAAGESDVALVNPRRKFVDTLTNGWDLTIPAPLSHGLTGATPVLGNLANASSVPMDPMASDVAEVVQTVSAWKVASSGLVSMKVKNCSSNGVATDWGDPGCLLTAPLDNLVLSVLDVAGKIQPVFSLADYHEVKELDIPSGSDCLFQNTCTEKPRRWVVEPVLEVAVPLAEKAEIQSLALPVRDALEVACSGSYSMSKEATVLHNGDTKAVANNALEENKCVLKQVLNEKGLPAYDLNLYGPQSMVVTVQQQGGEKVERAVILRPSPTRSTWLLPLGQKRMVKCTPLKFD
ncbi:MAG: hypothetical protein IPK82_30730 [Polyangiaceae bacterium]|nr:hypothetical protein [Polyangiaceae bacterium]